MKLFVDDQHRQFFRENTLIEFQGLLSPEKTKQWHDAFSRAVEKKKKQQYSEKVIDTFLEHGHQIWRDSSEIEQMVCSRQLAEIASELTGHRHLRIGYTQLYRGGQGIEGVQPLYSEARTLESVSCYQGLACGALIRLSGEGLEETSLPREAGSGFFYETIGEIDYPALARDEGLFLLIVYVTDKAVYVHQSNDPHGHEDKKLGYSFGDRLREKGHPTVWR